MEPPRTPRITITTTTPAQGERRGGRCRVGDGATIGAGSAAGLTGAASGRNGGAAATGLATGTELATATGSTMDGVVTLLSARARLATGIAGAGGSACWM